VEPPNPAVHRKDLSARGLKEEIQKNEKKGSVGRGARAKAQTKKGFITHSSGVANNNAKAKGKAVRRSFRPIICPQHYRDSTSVRGGGFILTGKEVWNQFLRETREPRNNKDAAGYVGRRCATREREKAKKGGCRSGRQTRSVRTQIKKNLASAPTKREYTVRESWCSRLPSDTLFFVPSPR